MMFMRKFRVGPWAFVVKWELGLWRIHKYKECPYCKNPRHNWIAQFICGRCGFAIASDSDM